MEDRPTGADVAELLQGADAPPLPDGLSAPCLWSRIMARRQPRTLLLRGSGRLDVGAILRDQALGPVTASCE